MNPGDRHVRRRQAEADEHLPLADHTRVNLTIEPILDRPEPAAAWQSLKARLKQRPVHAGGKHFTQDDLHERKDAKGAAAF